jgi:hypothetical protein
VEYFWDGSIVGGNGGSINLVQVQRVTRDFSLTVNNFKVVSSLIFEISLIQYSFLEVYNRLKSLSNVIILAVFVK